MALEHVAQAANGFAETDSEIDAGLQALRVCWRKPVGVRKNEFRVPEDANERIINFVAKNGFDVAGYVRPRTRRIQCCFREPVAQIPFGAPAVR